MKTRDTIILLVVVLLVGLFIFVYERNLPSTGELKEREGRILPRLDTSKVTRITIAAGGTTTVLERQGESEDWKMTSPVTADAEGAMVDGLLSDLEFMSFERKVEKATGEQRKGFGLVEPTLTAEVVQGGDLFKLFLGIDSEAGGVYLALDGDDGVFVVDPLSLETLRREPWEFRQKRLLGRQGGEVTIVETDRGEGARVVLGQVDGRWTVRVGDGSAERASQRAADKVVAALEGLKALRYLEDGVAEEDLASRGFDPGAPRVTWKKGDGSGGVLVFGGPCESKQEEDEAVEVLLVGTGTLACVGQAARDTILASVEDLRLLVPAEVDDYDVFSIEARRAGDVTVRLERDDDGEWSITAPGERRDAERSTVQDLIDALNKKKAPALLPLPADLAAAGLDPAHAVELVVLDVTGAEAASVALGRNDAGEVTFRRSGEDRYGVLGHVPALAGAADAWTYLRRVVLRRDYFDAVRLAVTGPVSHVLVKEEGAWRFESPAGLEADNADARDTVETFCSLEALRFLSDAKASTLQRYGLASPEWVVEVTYGADEDGAGTGDEAGQEPAGETIRLLLGAPVEEGRAAFIEGQGVDAVMLISDQVMTRLTRLLADRGAFSQATVDVTGVTFSRGGQSETFTVKGGRIEAHSAGKEGLIGLEDARDFYEKLATLRASHVVTYSGAPAKAKLEAPVLTATLAPSGAVVTFGAGLKVGEQSLVHAALSTGPVVYGVDATLLDFLKQP